MGSLSSLTATSSAAPSMPLTVTATVQSASGVTVKQGTVQPGTALTYTLTARSRQPSPAGATVIDDLSGLLGHATVSSDARELVKGGLALDPTHKTLTWKVPGTTRAPISATATFKANVATTAPGGTKLTTAAAPQGSSCSAGQPCATTLTVADAPRAKTTRSPSGTRTPPTTRAAPSAPNRTPGGRSPAALPRTESAAHPDISAQPGAASDPPLTCDPNTIFNLDINANIYALDPATRVNTRLGAFNNGGSGAFNTGGIAVNALGVTPGAPGTGAVTGYAVAQSGGTTLYRSDGAVFTVPGTSTVTFVMGAVDPVNGIYYYAGYSTIGTGAAATRFLRIFAFDPSRPAGSQGLGEVARVREAPPPEATNLSTVAGDFAFDLSGNLWILMGRPASGVGANTARIVRVDAAGLDRATAAAPLPPTSTPPTLTSHQLGSAFNNPPNGFFNGIAFGANANLYAQSTVSAGEVYLATINPTSPGTVTQLRETFPAGFPNGNPNDLAGCSTPGTLAVEKDLPDGRARGGDQFTLRIAQGTSVLDSETTSGPPPVTGVQPGFAATLAVPTTRYTISELPGNATTDLGDYTTTWRCEDTNTPTTFIPESGDGTSFDLLFPVPDTGVEGANIVCTFTNTPALPSPTVTDTVVHESPSPDGPPWGDSVHPAGTSAFDRATVTGPPRVPAPGGTVSFELFTTGGCTGPSTAVGGNVTLGADGVANSPETGPLARGNYSFRAHYSGDENYQSSSSDCEPFAVGLASTVTDTVVHESPSPDGPPWGDSVHPAGTSAFDRATVTGPAAIAPATGHVDFELFEDGDCTQPPIKEFENVELVDEVANSPETGPLTAGNYSFEALYVGDGNHGASISVCEPFAVGLASTVTDTVVHESPSPDGPPWGDSVHPAGTSAFDRATVTGPAAIAPANGHVDFELFSNGLCTDSPIATFENVALSGGVANSPDTGRLTAGNYSFRAVYSGDATHADSESECEPFGVAEAPSTTVTTVRHYPDGAPWVDTTPPGSRAFDTATVSGGPPGLFAPSGTVDFELFDNGGCHQPAATVQLGSPKAGRVTSVPTAPLAAGDYSYRVIYSGDFFRAASISECEPFAVAEAPTITATVVHESPSPDGPVWMDTNPAGSSAFDRVTVTGPAAIAPATGTVAFELFNNGDCTQPPVDTFEDVALSGGVANSPDTGPLTRGNYSFRAIYAGDGRHAPSNSACEPFGVEKAPTTPDTVVHRSPSPDGPVWVDTNPAGSSAFDRVTVTGPAAIAPATGHVDFELFNNGACRQPPIDTFEDVALSGGVANSPDTGRLTRGNYSFQAVYAGDDTHAPSISDCEPFRVVLPSISLTKTAFPTTYSAAGARITYTFHVVNTGEVELIDITLTDSRLGTITCPRTTLGPGSRMTCTATHTTTQADVDAGRIHNSARVTGRPPSGPEVTDSAGATVEFTGVRPPPAHTAPAAPAHIAPAAPAGPSPAVAFTGVPVGQFVLGATMLLALGGLLLMLARRLRRAAPVRLPPGIDESPR